MNSSIFEGNYKRKRKRNMIYKDRIIENVFFIDRKHK